MNKNEYYEQIVEDIKVKSSIEINNKMMNEFINLCKNYELLIDFIVYKNNIDSHIALENKKSCSILTVYIRNMEDYKKIEIDEIYNNWHNVYKNTTNIIQIWNKLMAKYNLLTNTNTEIFYLFFECTEKIVKNQIINNNKNLIDIVFKNNGLKKPKYVYVNSNPGYNIILKNDTNYNNFLIIGIENIKKEILSIINKNIGNEIINYDDFTINVFHMKMKDINLYGLSRED